MQKQSILNVDLHPTRCNLCGGQVEYIRNSEIYGRSYGSGWVYRCKNCGAYVGTHIHHKRDALGILSNREMRFWKQICHEVFDKQYKGKKNAIYKRNMAYINLAKKLNIPVESCHFGYFDLPMLKKAYQIMQKELVERNAEVFEF